MNRTNASINLFREKDDVVKVKEATFTLIEHAKSDTLNISFEKL